MFKWGNVLLILATFLAYLSPYINPEQFWVPSFIGLAYPFLLFAHLLFIVFWLMVKNRYFLFSLGCIILGWSHFTGFVGLNLVADTSDDTTIHVMSYNVFRLKKVRKKGEEVFDQELGNFSKALQKEGKPTIFCTQETVRPNQVQEKMGYPHFYKDKGVTIFTDYPILERGAIEFDNPINSCAWVDLKVKNKTIRVYNVHFKSNRISSTADKLVEKGNLQEKKTWLDIGSILRNVRAANFVRVKQAEKVAAHIASSPHPVIVCGDFNDTPQSYIYNLVSTGLQDTFKKKGFGLGTTYAGSIPALRIDFILADPKMKVLDYQIVDEDYSDHYPITSLISIGGN